MIEREPPRDLAHRAEVSGRLLSIKHIKPYLRSIIDLLKPVVALIVKPIDEDRSVVDTRAVLAPTFESHMGLGQVRYGRSMPGEIALGPVSTEDHGRAAIAVTVTTGFMLPGIPHIKDADGPHEVEFRSADINVRAILNKLEGLVGGSDIVDWQGLER